MTPEDIGKKVAGGSLPELLLVVGEETHARERVVQLVREAAVSGSMAAMNEDQFVASETTVDTVLSAARTLPMFGKRRFVLVKHLDRWETNKPSDHDPFERLLEYSKNPTPSTTLVLVAAKLDGRRRLVTEAKKRDFIVNCAPLPRAALPQWIVQRVRERGASISLSIADLIVEVTGTDLPALADATERLVLYVGQGKEIDERAVDTNLTKLSTATVWELVAAVGRRDLGAALRAVDAVYDPHDRGLPLLGVLAWSARQLIRFEAATRSGCNPSEAAQRAGAPPFKARELAEQTKLLTRAELERWLEVLARVDLALKGGSKRPPKAIIEQAVMKLARPQGAPKSARNVPTQRA
ncbi:MAG TPA: DNA polymerase III subunit delta [Polyangiaceae bacterium]|nr:DNA polymerase III subunit delta [Polyangiaceae bacterium]